MDESRLSRRRLFWGAAGLGLGGLFVGAGKARALSIQDGGAEASSLYFNSCAARPEHDKLTAEVRAMLEGKGAEEQARIRDAASLVLCPLCGCPIAAVK